MVGGQNPSNFQQYNEFVTLHQLGNATDFGDIKLLDSKDVAACNSIRGLYGGGRTTGDSINTMYYITIASSRKYNAIWRFNIFKGRSSCLFIIN